MKHILFCTCNFLMIFFLSALSCFAHEFVDAAGAGDRSTVKYFMENGDAVNLQNEYGYTALMKAAYSGYIDIVTLLLGKGANVNYKTVHGYTALMLAAAPGHTSIVALLLENEADINATDEKGNTALVYASLGQHQDVINLLNNANGQAFLRAVSDGNIGKTQMFLNEGMNVNILIDGISVLMEACAKGHTELVALLLAKGADVNFTDSLGQQALQLAASSGHVDVVKLLLEKGAFIDHQDLQNNTALMEGVKAGQSDVVQLLLAQNASQNFINNEGKTALELAEENNFTEIVRIISNNQQTFKKQEIVIFEDINKTQGDNSHATHIKKQDTSAQVFEKTTANETVATEKNITISSKYKAERSDIIVASMAGNINLVRKLLSQGADVNAREETFGYTPLLAAASRGHTHIVELLLKHQANIHYQDKAGKSVLMSAAVQGHASMVKLLLENGANADYKELNGKTALDFAAENGHTHVAQLLQNYLALPTNNIKNSAQTKGNELAGYAALLHAYTENFGALAFEKNTSAAHSETLFSSFGLAHINLKDLNGDGVDELIVARVHKNPIKQDSKIILGFDSDKGRTIQIFTLDTEKKLVFVHSLFPFKTENNESITRSVAFATVNGKEYIMSSAETNHSEKTFWQMQGHKLRPAIKFYYNPESDAQYKINGKEVDQEQYKNEHKKWFAKVEKFPLTNLTQQDCNKLIEFNTKTTTKLNKYKPTQGDYNVALFNEERFVILEDIPNASSEKPIFEYYKEFVTKDAQQLTENEKSLKGIIVEEFLTYTQPNLKKVNKLMAQASEADAQKFNLKDYRIVCSVNSLKVNKNNLSGKQNLWFLVGIEADASEWQIYAVYNNEGYHK